VKEKQKQGNLDIFSQLSKTGKAKQLNRYLTGMKFMNIRKMPKCFCGKKRPQLITDIEKRIVAKHIKTLQHSRRYRVDCKDEYITIYESNADIGNLKSIFGDFLNHTPLCSGMNVDDAMSTLVSIADHHYTAMLRFRLVDKKRRRFMAERFCFRGAIDGWMHIGGPDDLKTLLERYMKLLGTEEFFDSPYF